MELGIIIGYVAGSIFIFVSILLNADLQISGVLNFIDPPSVMITVGGTLASTIVAHPVDQLLNSIKAVKNVLKPKTYVPSEAISRIVELANLARKEGILALEDAAAAMEDEFLQKGIMLVVDGTDPELVRNILETEITFVEDRHKKVSGTWEYMASQGPAWGMIGTLVGLVMMLQNMSDPSSIGPAMATAIITTFYGSVLANFVFTPIANKMKIYSGDEILIKEILIEGILSIAAGENPHIIEEKLKVFLSPVMRAGVGTEIGGAPNREEVQAGDE